MSTAKKLSQQLSGSDKTRARKELLRRDDAFTQTVGQGITWIAARRSLATMIIVGVVALGVLIFGLSQYSTRRGERASAKLFEGLQVREAKIVADEDAKKAADTAGERVFTSRVERAQAALAPLQPAQDEGGGVALLAAGL